VDDISFAWDGAKDVSNRAKHGVSFSEAQTAFSDAAGLVIDDPQHSDDEERYVLLAMSSNLRLLIVVHTLRDNGKVIRIISARKATKQESRNYQR